tara:strand:- start:285 stop:665 length:381 start_codon:yes stop_codon:yes gene_type:complete
MADRFPLIANTSANQIQELPSGDNLNLIGNSIIGVSTIGVGTITASNIGVGTITASSFVKTDGSAIGGGGLTGGGSDQLFVESDNVMSSDFTTGANKNYLNLLPLTIDVNTTLTVTDGSFIQFVSA